MKTFGTNLPRFLPMGAGELIAAIHRAQDSIVSIEGNPDGKGWRALASLPKVELLSSPVLSPHLTRNEIYFSLASLYPSRHQHTSELGLPVYSRKHLRWINAIAADLDVSHKRAGFDFSECSIEVLDYTLKARLPLPSIICNSGRGLWLLWLLGDRFNRNDPLAAHGNIQAITSKIARAVVSQYRIFGADSHCTDAARVMRYPGSTNSKTGTAVEFFRVNDQVFTLPELADCFGVKAAKTAITRTDQIKSQRHTRAAQARWRAPLAGLQYLAEMRGKFAKGTRHCALYLFAALCRRLKVQDIQQEIEQFANQYCRGLDQRDIYRCVAAARKNYLHIRNDTVCRLLKITEKEKAVLTFWLRPPRVRHADEVIYRRSLIAAELRLAKGNISIRHLASLLKEKHGLDVGRSTVARDMAASTGTREEKTFSGFAGAQTRRIRSRSSTEGVPNPLLVERISPTGTSIKNGTPGTLPGGKVGARHGM